MVISTGTSLLTDRAERAECECGRALSGAELDRRIAERPWAAASIVQRTVTASRMKFCVVLGNGMADVYRESTDEPTTRICIDELP